MNIVVQGVFFFLYPSLFISHTDGHKHRTGMGGNRVDVVCKCACVCGIFFKLPIVALLVIPRDERLSTVFFLSRLQCFVTTKDVTNVESGKQRPFLTADSFFWIMFLPRSVR